MAHVKTVHNVRVRAVTASEVQTRALLSNVLKLRGATAYDVMLPRADIIALPADLTLDQIIKLGNLMMEIPRENIHYATIGVGDVTCLLYTSPSPRD